METRLVYYLIKMVVDKEVFLFDFIKLFAPVLIYRQGIFEMFLTLELFCHLVTFTNLLLKMFAVF